MLRFKVSHGKETRLISVGDEYSALEEVIKDRFQLHGTSLLLTWIDSEGDTISISSQADLNEMQKELPTPQARIRLNVTSITPTVHSPRSSSSSSIRSLFSDLGDVSRAEDGGVERTKAEAGDDVKDVRDKGKGRAVEVKKEGEDWSFLDRPGTPVETKEKVDDNIVDDPPEELLKDDSTVPLAPASVDTLRSIVQSGLGRLASTLSTPGRSNVIETLVTELSSIALNTIEEVRAEASRFRLDIGEEKKSKDTLHTPSPVPSPSASLSSPSPSPSPLSASSSVPSPPKSTPSIPAAIFGSQGKAPTTKKSLPVALDPNPWPYTPVAAFVGPSEEIKSKQTLADLEKETEERRLDHRRVVEEVRKQRLVRSENRKVTAEKTKPTSTPTAPAGKDSGTLKTTSNPSPQSLGSRLSPRVIRPLFSFASSSPNSMPGSMPATDSTSAASSSSSWLSALPREEQIALKLSELGFGSRCSRTVIQQVLRERGGNDIEALVAMVVDRLV